MTIVMASFLISLLVSFALFLFVTIYTLLFDRPKKAKEIPHKKVQLRIDADPRLLDSLREIAKNDEGNLERQAKIYKKYLRLK